MKRNVISILTCLWLTACSQSGWVRQDTASTLYLPPVGTLVELKQPLTVRPGRARVFLQGGRFGQAINQFEPNCNFVIRTLSEQPQVIKPDTFLVVRVQRVTEEVVQLTRPIRVAGLGALALDSSGGYSMVTRGVHLWFGSDTQPEVMRMTCRGGFDDPWRAKLPSIDQIRAVLGAYASLTLP
ncbi:MAG: hypothetical protein PVG22_01950 [Chromatiales bacterium]|jgi:hypothetical protein